MGAIKHVRDLQAGGKVRVVFRSNLASRLFNFNPTGLKEFGRSFAGSFDVDPIPKRRFRQAFGFNRRDFLAQVLENDTAAKTLTLEIEHTQPLRRVRYYRIRVPWNEIFRLSELVLGGKPVDEEEERKRRVGRRRINGFDFFHPFDQFVPLDLAG